MAYPQLSLHSTCTAARATTANQAEVLAVSNAANTGREPFNGEGLSIGGVGIGSESVDRHVGGA